MLGWAAARSRPISVASLPDAAITRWNRPRGHHRRENLFRPARDRAPALTRAGDGRVMLNRSSRALRPHPARRLSRRLCAVPSLTREFYTLVKQRLAPGGAAAFNVHDGSKLYASTSRRWARSFTSALDLYSDRDRRGDRGCERRGSRQANARAQGRAAPGAPRLSVPLPQLLQRRMDNPQGQAANGDLITDDFAPADVRRRGCARTRANARRWSKSQSFLANFSYVSDAISF